MPAIQLPVFVVVINFRAQLVYFFDLLGKFVLAGAAKEHRYQGFFFPGKCLIKGGHFRGGRIRYGTSIGFHILNIHKNPYYPKAGNQVFNIFGTHERFRFNRGSRLHSPKTPEGHKRHGKQACCCT